MKIFWESESTTAGSWYEVRIAMPWTTMQKKNAKQMFTIKYGCVVLSFTKLSAVAGI